MNPELSGEIGRHKPAAENRRSQAERRALAVIAAALMLASVLVASSTVLATGTSNTISLDGSVKGECAYTGSCSVALTTTRGADVIVVGCDCSPYSVQFTVTDAAGLTFHPRTAQLAFGGGQFVQTWYAVAPAPLTADKISVQTTSNGGTGYGIIAFGVSGANVTNPFDANPSLPRAQANISCPGNEPCNTGVSTNGADFVFQVGGGSAGTAPQTAGGGFTLIQAASIQAGSLGEEVFAQYQVGSSALSSATLSFGTPQTSYFGVVADAIRPATTSTTTATTSTTSSSTTTTTSPVSSSSSTKSAGGSPTVSTILTQPNSGDITAFDAQAKVFFAAGLYWAFFLDSSIPSPHVSYATSADGVTWSSPTQATTESPPDALTFSAYVNGTTLYYVYCPNQSNNFIWRYGTLNANGTITWGIPETMVTTVNGDADYPTLALDSSGNLWVSLSECALTHQFVDVYEYSHGVWSNMLEREVGSAGRAFASIIALPSGNMALVYIVSSNGQAYISSWNGATWSEPVSPLSQYNCWAWDAVAAGNNVNFVGLVRNGTQYQGIKYWNSAYPFTIVSPETILNSTAFGDPVITTNGGSTLVVAYASSTTTVVYRVSTNSGGSWTSESTLTRTAQFDTATGYMQASVAPVTRNGVAYLEWVESGGSGPNYPVRFATFSTGGITSTSSSTTTASSSTATATSSSQTSTSFSQSPLSIDGSAKAGCGYVESCAVSLSTTHASDLILVGCDCFPVGASFSLRDTAGLTFTPRTAQVAIGGGQFIQTWYAVAPASLSGDSISVVTTDAGETWYGVIAFAVSGANLENPFVPSFSLPIAQANIHCPSNEPCNTGVSANAGDLVFQFGGDTGSTAQTAGTGLTLIQDQRSGENAYSQYEVASASLSSATLSFGKSQGYDFGVIADTIQPGSSAFTSSSTTSTTTTMTSSSSSSSPAGSTPPPPASSSPWIPTTSAATPLSSVTVSSSSSVMPSSWPQFIGAHHNSGVGWHCNRPSKERSSSAPHFPLTTCERSTGAP